MKKAIALSYVEDQNEPSIPRPTLVELPDDPAEREAVMKEVFLESFDEMDDDSITVNESCKYGDIEIGCDGVYVFFTYVD